MTGHVCSGDIFCFTTRLSYNFLLHRLSSNRASRQEIDIPCCALPLVDVPHIITVTEICQACFDIPLSLEPQTPLSCPNNISYNVLHSCHMIFPRIFQVMTHIANYIAKIWACINQILEAAHNSLMKFLVHCIFITLQTELESVLQWCLPRITTF
jgi:hypothetical protein